MALLTSVAGAQELGTIRTDYQFPRIESPKIVKGYSTTIYSAGDNYVTTMRGESLRKSKNVIDEMSLNPAGISFVVITHDKKGRTALEVYDTQRAEHRMFNFDVRLYGTPQCAVFSPDARLLYVATDKGLCEFEVKKFKLVKQYGLPIIPQEMTASGNGYFLAMTRDNKVYIYNLQDHKIRTVLDEGEAVNDVTFSKDSDMMGVLLSDGVLKVYETRGFTLRTSVDGLGQALACAFNETGKYVAVATADDAIRIVNLVRPSDTQDIEVPERMLADLEFIKDSNGNNLLVYTSRSALLAKRLMNLEPYYAKLLADEVDARMAEWMKMMPGETMEAYQLRMEGQAKQRRLLEDEISTGYAGDMLAMPTISLGGYDRGAGRLEIGFSNMPTIYLPVAEEDVVSFSNPGDLEFSDARYGLTADDNFELIYAKIRNKADGKTYTYDNLDRVPMNFMQSDDNIVSLEVLRQQQMEVAKLEEVRQAVIEEAKHANVISDHTNIQVDSRVVPSYNANGDKILNYVVKVTYTVDPEFSAVEDFGPGKYKVAESGAASSMLKIVKEAFEGDFAQYVQPGAKMNVTISGTADATPIVRGIPYDGSFGVFDNEPVYQNGTLGAITVEPATGIKTNEQLAFVRAAACKDYLEKNVKNFNTLDRNYRYNVDVSADKGSQHRRITTEFEFVDAFK